jgi:hypothetical protein
MVWLYSLLLLEWVGGVESAPCVENAILYWLRTRTYSLMQVFGRGHQVTQNGARATSVADPDPKPDTDPHVFGSPGSRS